jgi:CRISPR/Cas system CSM-associated protein Csm3 (group 7 of RAMP superfamily)
VPILAGTSWAGVLRSRAAQIAYTLSPAASRKRADQLINGIFGPAEIKSWRRPGNGKAPVKASRLEVKESEIEQGRLLEQTRVKIDRFTGGAFESALFSEQPLFGSDATRLALDLSLRLPAAENDEARQRQEKAEIGLLLLLLKDLWTGDLPLGGEISSGRGRLRGVRAEIKLHGQPWLFTQNTAGYLEIVGDRDMLQSFVAALKEELHHV